MKRHWTSANKIAKMLIQDVTYVCMISIAMTYSCIEILCFTIPFENNNGRNPEFFVFDNICDKRLTDSTMNIWFHKLHNLD